MLLLRYFAMYIFHQYLPTWRYVYDQVIAAYQTRAKFFIVHLIHDYMQLARCRYIHIPGVQEFIRVGIRVGHFLGR